MNYFNALAQSEFLIKFSMNYFEVSKQVVVVKIFHFQFTNLHIRKNIMHDSYKSIKINGEYFETLI